MFPSLTFMCVVAGFAALLAAALPFSGMRGFIRNCIVSVFVLFGLVGAGVLLVLISTQLFLVSQCLPLRGRERIHSLYRMSLVTTPLAKAVD
jgi:hypothetical protein